MFCYLMFWEHLQICFFIFIPKNKMEVWCSRWWASYFGRLVHYFLQHAFFWNRTRSGTFGYHNACCRVRPSKEKTLKHRASFLKSTLYYYVTMYYHPVPWRILDCWYRFYSPNQRIYKIFLRSLYANRCVWARSCGPWHIWEVETDLQSFGSMLVNPLPRTLAKHHVFLLCQVLLLKLVIVCLPSFPSCVS